MRTHKDLLSKRGLQFCVGHTLAPLGLNLPRIVAAVPTESLVVRSRLTDVAFRLADDTLVHIEQISGDHAADLYHVLVGAALRAEEHRGPVHVVVLYTERVCAAPDTLDVTSIVLRVSNVYGSDLDGDATLDAIVAKVGAGAGLQGEDAMAVAFIGVMRHTLRSLATAIREGLKLAATLPTRREREGCAAAVVMLAQNRLRAEEIAELVEVFALAAPRMVDVLERIGREKGKAEGKAEDVLLVLRRRCGEPAEAVARRISTERDLAVLDRWLNVALTCASLEHFTMEAVGAKG